MKICDHFLHCSGCIYERLDQTPAIYEKAASYFQNEHKLALSLKKGSPYSWRTRAKLAVRKGPNGPLIGLFEKNSHNVSEIPRCLVHHPAINEAVKLVLQQPFSAYDETTGTGDLRYIQCSVERHSNLVQLSFVLNLTTDSTHHWQELAKRLYNDHPWHSIWLNCNSAKTNTIFGPDWIKVVGQDAVWESLNGIETAMGPAHFSQANLEMYEALLADIKADFPENRRVLELYAGIGSIGLQIAEKSKSLLLTEVQGEAKPYFEMALHRHQSAQKVSYKVLAADSCLDLIEEHDVCIVDPPRKGLGKKVALKLAESKNLETIVYVSCNFESLASDLSVLCSSNTLWRPISAKSYLFFPGTNHIETVVVLTKI